MSTFRITCTPNVPTKKLHPLDQAEGPSEITHVDADTEDEALDRFHDENPIKVLDNYDIDCEEMKEGEEA